MKNLKKFVSVFLIFIMIFTVSMPVNVEAAIKIDKTKATMYVGKSETLKISGTSKKVNWSSSDKKIATVNSKGKVIPKKQGNVTITAKVSGKKYICKVTVKKPYINSSKKLIYVGSTYTLKLTGTDIKSVKTSNSKIATVSKKGKVTAKKAGTAQITLKGKDGKAYKCTITVKKPSINTSKKTLEIGETCTLKLTGTSIKSVSSSDSKVATVSKKGKVTAKKAGSAKITLKGKDGKSYKCTITVNKVKDVHEHKYTSKVTKEATCAAKGVKTYTCECGDSYTEDIPKTDNHNWDNGKVIKEATCTSSGDKIYTCITCKETKTEIIVKTHSVGEWIITKDATCLESGLKIRKCTSCDKILEQEAIIATGHSWGEWETIVEATDLTTGLRKHVCSVCGKEAEDEIPAKEHEHKCISTVVEPTCTEGGYTWHECACGYCYRTDYVSAIGHVKYYDEFNNGTLDENLWVVIKEPTCTEAGKRVVYCERCGTYESLTDTLPAAHKYSDWAVTKEASMVAATTVDDFGSRERTCSACGHVDTQTIINIDLGSGGTKLMYGNFADDMAYETLALVNELRAEVGAEPLTWQDKFSDIGKIRSVEIEHRYTHTRPNGEEVGYVIDEDFTLDLGENIWAGATIETAKIAVDGWSTSEGHYANMIKSTTKSYYCSCFITYDNSGNPWYNWVQLFSAY